MVLTILFDIVKPCIVSTIPQRDAVQEIIIVSKILGAEELCGKNLTAFEIDTRIDGEICPMVKILQYEIIAVLTSILSVCMLKIFFQLFFFELKPHSCSISFIAVLVDFLVSQSRVIEPDVETKLILPEPSYTIESKEHSILEIQ